MVESIRTKLMQWFCLRRAKAKRLALLADPITPNVNKLMIRYHTASAGLNAAYEEFIFPVPNQGDAEVPDVVEQEQYNPPRNPPGPGRRRKRRIPSTGEHVVFSVSHGGKRRKSGPHKCSICYEAGHNRATCSNPAV
ncbi:hypothetical protein ARALYDRAFT_359386 [Arabidopsis lyrata subsp. lyrata]|uniref:Uncharacterized protein n=1 Tax=Arabidopsis lyrata subsp. lyrata TaxID=81972 RepID=D7MWP8_ARALL|nr:hypothetical protein ARALYDRAFT_359386 [Arabidopsis lyrata subsp. lyrata]